MIPGFLNRVLNKKNKVKHRNIIAIVKETCSFRYSVTNKGTFS